MNVNIVLKCNICSDKTHCRIGFAKDEKQERVAKLAKLKRFEAALIAGCDGSRGFLPSHHSAEMQLKWNEFHEVNANELALVQQQITELEHAAQGATVADDQGGSGS